MIWLAWFVYFGISAGMYVGIKDKDEIVGTFKILVAVVWPVAVGYLIVIMIDYFDEKEKN